MEITSILCGGQEIRSNCRIQGTEISKDLGGRVATCTLDIMSMGEPSGTGDMAIVGIAHVGAARVGRAPVPRREIFIIGSVGSGSFRQFAGYISRIEPVREAPGMVVHRITCQDYTSLLETVVIESEVFTSQPDTTILDYLFSSFLPVISTALIENVGTVSGLELRDVTLREAMDKIIERTGAEWYIDFDLQLHYYAQANNPAAFGLSENANDVTTFDLLREGFSHDEDFSTPANSVRVIGVAGTSTNSVVDHNGAAGDDGHSLRVAGSYPPDAGGPIIDTTSVTATTRNGKSGASWFLGVSLLRFDTSAIPDTATITSATLMLFSSVPFNANLAELGVEYYASGNWPIDSTDYTSTPSNSAFGYQSLVGFVNGGWNSLPLNSPDANINKTGFTGFRLHVKTSGAPTGENWFQWDTQESSNKPVLQVAYHIGTPDIDGSASDAASIALYGTLQRTIVDRSIQTVAEANLRAQIEVARFAHPQESGTALTHRDGLNIGELISIDAPSVGVFGQYVIRRMRMHWITSALTEYRLDYGDYRPDLIKFLRIQASR